MIQVRSCSKIDENTYRFLVEINGKEERVMGYIPYYKNEFSLVQFTPNQWENYDEIKREINEYMRLFLLFDKDVRLNGPK